VGIHDKLQALLLEVGFSATSIRLTLSPLSEADQPDPASTGTANRFHACSIVYFEVHCHWSACPILGETVVTGGEHYSPVNNVWGNILWATLHTIANNVIITQDHWIGNKVWVLLVW